MFERGAVGVRGAVCRLVLTLVALTHPQLAAAEVIALKTLEAQALRQRPALAATDARVLEARAHVDLARSAYAPRFSLIGSAALAPGQKPVRITSAADDKRYLVSGSLEFSDPDAWGPLPRYGATLDARSNLYDFGRTSAAVDAALAQRRAAEADAEREGYAIVRDVRLGYVRWATAHALQALSQQTLVAAEQSGAQTAGSIAEGARPTSDQIAVRTQAAMARIELDRARAEVELARMDLGFLCATELGDSAEPDPAVLAAGAPPADGSPADPAAQALELQRTAAQASARVHDHAFAPILGAEAQAGMQGQGVHVFPLYRLGVSLSVPLFDGGGDAAERAAALARASQIDAELQQYQRQRVQARARSRAAHAQASRRIALCEDLIGLSQTRLSQLEEAFPLGAASLQELADARAALQRAQVEMVRAQALRAEAALGL